MKVQRAVPLGEQVAIALQRAIVTGEEPAGSILTEEALADRFNVSRGPIRDAFRRLELQHLVEKSGRSFTVIGLQQSDLDEIYRLRARIESIAWGYLHSAGGDHRTVEEALQRMGDAADQADADAFAQADIDFHSAAVRLTGKRRVIAMWDNIEPSMRLILQFTNILSDDFPNVYQRHARLLEVLRTGTEDELEIAITNHIETSRHLLP